MNTDWDMLDPREWGTPALRAALELVGQRDSVEHRVFQRILSVLCAIAAFGLVAATGVFMLDAIQVRSLMRPEAMSSWAVATGTAVAKLGVAILAIALFAVAGFRNSKAPKQAQRGSGADLLVGSAKPRHAGASATP